MFCFVLVFSILEKKKKTNTFFQSGGRRKLNSLRKLPVSLLEIFDQAELAVYTE